MNTIRQRLNNLSDKQRLLLSRWLNIPGEVQYGRKELVAYITPKPGKIRIDENELRRSLKDRLPSYMLPDHIVILDELPRLPNGKLDSKSLPQMVAQSSGGSNAQAVPTTETEKILAEIWSQLLGADLLGVQDNFFEFGGDSITSIQLVSKVREAGYNMLPTDILDHPTIGELAAVISKSASRNSPDVTDKSGTALALPIQQWFLERNLYEPNHWNQSKHLELDRKITPEICEAAVSHLLDVHSGLNSCFERMDGKWHLSIPKSTEHAVFAVQTLDRADVRKLEETISQAHQNFDIIKGPLVRFVYIQFGDDGPDELHIAAHHLVVDNVSWLALLDDLQTLIHSLVNGRAVKLIPPATSLMDWTEHLGSYSSSSRFSSELHFWNNWQNKPLEPIPVDMQIADQPTEASRDTISVCLDVSTTQNLLGKANEAYRTNPVELLLASLAVIVSDWTNSHCVAIDLERHGRESELGAKDISRTVGWLTSYFPLLLETNGFADLEALVMAVKETHRNIPESGIAYGVARFLHSDNEVSHQLGKLQPCQILFNYLGANSNINQNGNLFKIVGNHDRVCRAPTNTLSHLLEINALVDDNRQLKIVWAYSNLHYRKSTIEAKAMALVTHLEKLIGFCLAKDDTRFTPSDFPETEMDQDELDKFLSNL